MSVAINIENVVKRFGKDTIINGLSLNIKEGEFFTLLGPSGCGKTTLLRMIIGFNSIEGGEIKLDEKLINNIPTNKRNMGMVFQNYAIFPHMSVKDNVAFGLKRKKMSKQEIDEKVDEILKIVKIDHLKDRMPVKLSGGQQQRVALARAIVIHPEVLLMDEPLSNLDAKLRVEMRNAIKRIQQQIGITTVYVTHDQEEALAVSDRIAVMNGGVIQQIDTPKRIYQRPSNTFVATFIGQSNILDGQVIKNNSEEGIKIFDAFFAMTNLSKNCTNMEDVKVSIRPEEFILSMDNKDGIKGVVKSSVFLGINTNYFIELENGKEVEVIQASDALEAIPDGSTVYLKLQTEKINVFIGDGTKNLIKGV